ncbi:iron-containing alcohol dehydrogenase [Saccharopolyspora shandongensis]|uniref:iron-containing alcohol dehydrogenase n=1 Tax=Saccharopolyspora shandongensis TaxID=418495 RepID=UPI0034108D41
MIAQPFFATAKHREMPPGSLAFLPVERVVWGFSVLGSLGDLLRDFGAKRVVLLTTASLVAEKTLLASVEQALAGLLTGRCASLAAHVPAEGVAQARRLYQETRADTLVTMGGGSVIDAGKAVAGELLDAGLPKPVHVAVPTTLSGAELSHYYGVTTTKDAVPVKRSFAREECTPSVVVYDPVATLATPPPLWTSSGIKALDHAIEGLLSRSPNPVVDSLAFLGIRRLATAIEKSLDVDALGERLEAQLAAWQCFFAPGSVSLGLSHRIGHVLGGTFGVAHGLTSCVTLAPVMRMMAPAAPARLAAIEAALDLDQPFDLTAPHTGDPLRAADRVEALVRSLGLPARLGALGIEREQLPILGRILWETYPEAVGQLAGDSDDPLKELLHDMW